MYRYRHWWRKRGALAPTFFRGALIYAFIYTITPLHECILNLIGRLFQDRPGGTFGTEPGIFEGPEILRMPRINSLKQQLLTG